MNPINIQISTSSRVLSITKLQVKFRYYFPTTCKYCHIA